MDLVSFQTFISCQLGAVTFLVFFAEGPAVFCPMKGREGTEHVSLTMGGGLVSTQGLSPLFVEVQTWI